MKIFSLRTLIDDILLLVRNNNVSESEDFSRSQIRAWIMQYKALLAKQKSDQDKELSDDDYSDDSLTETKGPIELVKKASLDCNNLYTRRTKDKIPELLNDSSDSIISVTDQDGCQIQPMAKERRHYHWFRQYTHSELTYYYQDGYIYVQGNIDCEKLKFIWVTGVWVNDSDDKDEDDISIPGWMIPTIKQLIIKNELAFMLRLPSDDSNNATLQGIKPHGPQDTEK